MGVICRGGYATQAVNDAERRFGTCARALAGVPTNSVSTCTLRLWSKGVEEMATAIGILSGIAVFHMCACSIFVVIRVSVCMPRPKLHVLM